MNENIKNLIQTKKPNIDENLLKYLVDYFSIVIEDNLLPDNIDVNDVIDRTLSLVDKIVFYTEQDEIYKKLGPDVKGKRDEKTKTIYVRDSLESPLKEITVYHEIHHFAQTNKDNNEVGINQIDNKGRLIMEAQTQYMAEKVYCEINKIDFPEKEYKSEDLRMLPGGIVISNLHNYQMYDCILSKLAILLNVSKDYFVKINYDFANGLKDLESKYNEANEKYSLPKDFDSMMFDLDYIYVVDYLSYINNPEKEIISSGKVTENAYEIEDEKGKKLSLAEQQRTLLFFDREYFISLLSNGGDFSSFGKYIVDNKTRELFIDFISNKIKDISSE